MDKDEVNIEDIEQELTEEEVEQVKGGPLTGYLKIPDIKGESFAFRGGGGGAGKVKFDRLSIKKKS